MSLTTSTPIVIHGDIATFASEKVNLRREDAKEYREQVNRLRDKLDAFIRKQPDVGLVKMLLSGSLAKGTALKTLNDIDVAVYVDGDKTPQNEVELLRWLAEKLREAYPQMDSSQISQGDHAVRISFRGTGLDVDVVPVYYFGEAEDRGYVYSQATGERIMTSIPLHIKFIRDRKAQQPDHYAQVIRLVKWWTRQTKSEDQSFRFKSFLAELVVSYLVDNEHDLSDYPAALEQFFGYVKKSSLEDRLFFTDNYSESKLPGSLGDAIEAFDPVNPDNNAGKGYSHTDREKIVEHAEEALDALAYARVATTKAEAVEAWQVILGPSFRG